MAVMDIIVRAEDQAGAVLSGVDSDIEKIGDSGVKAGKKLGDAFQEAGKKMTDAGKKLTTRVSLPLIGAGIAAIKFGSDLSESMSQVGTVFGDEASKVVSASENMNDAFSQADFLGFAGNIGDIAQGLGIAKEESDDLALGVISLGQDLSSFKNVPVEQAVNAITSALAGERESLKGLGIVLKDVDVKQRAMELGLWDGVEALSSSAQAQATMSLITEKSANSIGDFEKTQDGAANKARILKANVVDMAASFGKKLLPMAEKVLGVLDDMIGFFTDLPGPAKDVILVVGGLAAAIGPLLFVAGKLTLLMGPGGTMVTGFQTVAKGFSKMSKIFIANPWILLAVAVVAIVVLIIKNWDKIKKFLTAVWDWMKGAVKAIGDFFTGVWEKVSETVVKLWTELVDFFKELPGNIMDAIASFATTVFEFIMKWHPLAILTRLFIEFWPEIKEFFTSLPGKIIDAIAGLASAVWDFIVKWHPLAILFRKVKEVWPSVLSWLRALPRKIIDGIAGLATTVWTWIVQHHPIAILFRKAKEFWPEVKTWFTELPGKIVSSIGDLAKLLFNTGKDILNGLWDGLKDIWNKMTGWLSGLGSKIANLKGPAAVDAVLLTKNGELIMGGLLAGLRKKWSKVQAFMSERSSEMESAFGEPTLGVSGIGAMDASSRVGLSSERSLTLMSEQNEMLRRILAKTGFSIDGRDMVDTLGSPLVEEIRSRTGL